MSNRTSAKGVCFNKSHRISKLLPLFSDIFLYLPILEESDRLQNNFHHPQVFWIVYSPQIQVIWLIGA